MAGVFNRWAATSAGRGQPQQMTGVFNRWPVSSTDEPRPLQMKGSFNRWMAPGALYPPQHGGVHVAYRQAGRHVESWEFWRTQMLKNLNVEELDCWRTWPLKMLKMLTAEKLRGSSADVESAMWFGSWRLQNGQIHDEDSTRQLEKWFGNSRTVESMKLAKW